MAFHKKEFFEKKEQELSHVSKAFGHPARIAIFKLLAQLGECNCNAIVEQLPLAQSTVSQHLKELVAAGLIEGTTDGARSRYYINWKAYEKYNRDMNALFDRLQRKREKLK